MTARARGACRSRRSRRPQASRSPAQPTVTLGPGGLAFLPVTVRRANAATGTNDGFIVLSGNGVQRRVPYALLVERPALRDAPSTPLKEIAGRQHREGNEQGLGLLLPGRAVRPAADLHRRRP